ncbi:hypothetical protein [Flavobacterium selenitireducens]|uniref:hypothetical protein n=1 Tax=Flavobacterium selenitireducens TaxID=2722704 RepID=UPI00168AE1AD|nr:hypothetical protein [Flavobacterium selenitireducens]MBD3582629.1 hypothetical protein [Flavobacterium selenitireducens]
MTYKHFLVLLALVGPFTISAQYKELDFSGFQVSDAQMHWQNVKRIVPRKARFSDSQIVLALDRNYQLSVHSKKNLPDGGIVYLCKDQQQRDVTITLIGNERMFLYSGKQRYQVTFSNPIIASTQRSYAESD